MVHHNMAGKHGEHGRIAWKSMESMENIDGERCFASLASCVRIMPAHCTRHGRLASSSVSRCPSSSFCALPSLASTGPCKCVDEFDGERRSLANK